MSSQPYAGCVAALWEVVAICEGPRRMEYTGEVASVMQRHPGPECVGKYRLRLGGRLHAIYLASLVCS